MQHVNRGVRVTTAQFERWQLLAKRAGINRNRLIGLLIDNAEVKLEVKANIGHEKSAVSIVRESNGAFMEAN